VLVASDGAARILPSDVRARAGEYRPAKVVSHGHDLVTEAFGQASQAEARVSDDRVADLLAEPVQDLELGLAAGGRRPFYFFGLAALFSCPRWREAREFPEPFRIPFHGKAFPDRPERSITMAESLQHKLDRVRRPRVQITYDVETNGAMQKVELPFVVGVLADLSGQPKEALRPLKERKFVNIDRDNFNDVLARSTPRLAMRVQNRLTDEDTKLAVELNFKEVDDFEPARVAEQVAPLKELLDMRQRLTQLLSKMEGNDKLEQLLGDVLSNTEKAMALAKQMGIEAPSQSPKPEEST
jgi:type VI secretion system protein ImpB